MKKASQQIINILTACGCKPVANGNTIRVNAPTITGDKKKEGGR
jgi:ribosome recycling factor